MELQFTMTSQESTIKRQDSLSRRPLSKAMLPVQGEALDALGDLGDFNSSVTSLFNKYASNEISSTEEFSGDVKATTALRKRTRSEQNEHELFMELIYDIQHELNVERLCFKILHNIAVLTNCDRSSLFLTRKEGDQKFLVCKLFDLTSNSQYEDVVRSEDSTFIVPFGTGVIGHVAESKEFVQINNAYEVRICLHQMMPSRPTMGAISLFVVILCSLILSVYVASRGPIALIAKT